MTVSSSRAYKGFSTSREVSIAVSTEDDGLTITTPGQSIPEDLFHFGLIRRVWIYVDGGDANSSRDVSVKIYRDGETTAGTNTSMQVFFGFVGATSAIRTGVWLTTFIVDDTNFIYSADLSILEYFKSTWKIAIKNNSAAQVCTAKYNVQGFYF